MKKKKLSSTEEFQILNVEGMSEKLSFGYHHAVMSKVRIIKGCSR